MKKKSSLYREMILQKLDTCYEIFAIESDLGMKKHIQGYVL